MQLKIGNLMSYESPKFKSTSKSHTSKHTNTKTIHELNWREWSDWEILDVPPGSTPEEIKKAYHKMALKYHPDVNHDPDATEFFKRISQAYEDIHTGKRPRPAFPSTSSAPPPPSPSPVSSVQRTIFNWRYYDGDPDKPGYGPIHTYNARVEIQIPSRGKIIWNGDLSKARFDFLKRATYLGGIDAFTIIDPIWGVVEEVENDLYKVRRSKI
jgi:hypothetical protein